MLNIFENEIPLGFIIPVTIAVYFLPSIIAIFLNRENKKKIILANLPAGFAWTLWFGVLIWAVTGKPKEQSKSDSSNA